MMLAFLKYCAASFVALVIVALLCALVQQWDAQGNPAATICAAARCI
jgi:hypothetical protein